MWCEFLLRGFFIRVSFLTFFYYKFSYVEKCNSCMIFSEIHLSRDSFSCGDQSVSKKWGSIDWFLYGASCRFLRELLERIINNSCVKICSSSNTLQFFDRSPNNVITILWKNFTSWCFVFYCDFICFLCDPVTILFCKVWINWA